MDKIETRYQQLKGKDKKELWAIRRSQVRVIDEDPQYRKSWLIGDILVDEFGKLKVEEWGK